MCKYMVSYMQSQYVNKKLGHCNSVDFDSTLRYYPNIC
uniref:Uncharacterized protein n=1 Tax=Arundo donax TaxID=35708 RepID=A0A0A8YYT8_ARUDO